MRRAPGAAALLAAILALAGTGPALAEDSLAQPVPAPSAARPDTPVASSRLVEEARALDGARLAFEGEAIGAALSRGGYAWLNLSDGSYAIGIWLPRAETGKVRRYGSYTGKGDLVRVEGVFHRSCPEHGGDLDIHAEQLEIVAAGAPAAHPVGRGRLILAGALLLAGLAVVHLWRRTGRGGRSPSRGGQRRWGQTSD